MSSPASLLGIWYSPALAGGTSRTLEGEGLPAAGFHLLIDRYSAPRKGVCSSEEVSLVSEKDHM